MSVPLVKKIRSKADGATLAWSLSVSDYERAVEAIAQKASLQADGKALHAQSARDRAGCLQVGREALAALGIFGIESR